MEGLGRLAGLGEGSREDSLSPLPGDWGGEGRGVGEGTGEVSRARE